MDYRRASEIIKSQETIEVTYNGQNIWIKNLDHDNNTAVVAPATEGQPDITVSIDELQEN